MKRTYLGVLIFAILTLSLSIATPRLVRAWQSANSPNLLSNSDFEAGDTEDWIFCGGAQLVDAQAGATAEMVHSGRYAMRMGQPMDNSCGNDALGPSQIAVEDITIPSDAQDVTISFWYSAVGDYPVGEVVLSLGEKPTSYLSSPAFITEINMDELMPGWQLFRQNLRGEQIQAVRGKTLYLTLQVRFQGNENDNWALYFDDMRAVPSWERTQAEPLPADLKGDGAQPLLVMGHGQAPENFGIQRMDTDGGNRIVIHDSVLQPDYLTWSPDGNQIAFRTRRPFPETPSSVNHFQALVSDAFLLDADGSNVRHIYQTSGVEGQKESPAGCLRTNTCADRGQDAIDARIEDMAWSPDGSQIVSTICLESRWYNGDKDIRGCSYHLARQEVPAAGNVPDITLPAFIDVAQSASWAANNQLLFQRPGSIGEDSLPAGVWSVDMSQPAPQPQLVQSWLTGYSGSNTLDLRASPEIAPVWAPDGRHFVTYRVAQGVRYVEKLADDITFSALRTNYTIMLHDRQDRAATRMLLYVDQGTLIARPTWSPDGRYLLYVVLADNRQSADIWWLHVATGATGQVTNDGVSYEVNWRPTHQLSSPAPTDTPVASPTPNTALTERLYLPVAKGGSGGAPQPTATPISTGSAPGFPVRFPTVTATATPVPLPTPANPTPVPPRGIRGFVTYKGAPVAGIEIQLEVCLIGGSCEAHESTATDANGQYNFPYAPTYNGAFAYQATYRNGPEGGNVFDDRYLLTWQEPRIFDYDYAQRVEGGNFDIANVELTSPADNAVIPSPATFSWQSRGIAGEQNQWFIDAVFDSGFCDQQVPDTNTSFEFSGLDCSIFPELSPNEPYEWYIVVHGENGGSGQSQARTVTFTQ